MSNYFHRLLMRSVGKTPDINPISHQPYARLSNQAGLDPLDEGSGLNGEPWAVHLLEQESNKTLFPLKGRDTPQADSVTKAGMPGAHRADGREVLIHQSALQPTHKETERPAIDLSHTSPLSDPASYSNSGSGGENAESARNHHAGSKSEKAQPLRDEGQRPLQRSSAIDDLRLLPLQSQSNAAEPSSVRTSVWPSDKALGMANAANQSPERNGQSGTTPAPEIHITIGRVEVRATLSQPQARKSSPKSSAMSLDEYLKQRDEARR